MPPKGSKGSKTSVKKEEPAVKVEPAAATKKAKRHKKRKPSWNTYVYKVLQQVAPDVGMTKISMSSINTLVNDALHRLGHEASRMVMKDGKKTVGSGDIQTATRLIFPGELGVHAVSEGVKATTAYSSSKSKGKSKKKSSSKKKHVSGSARAGLQFPVGRVLRILRDALVAKKQRVSHAAGVFLAAVLEYLVAEILELAGNARLAHKRIRINNAHLQRAVREDAELSWLFRDFSFRQGGAWASEYNAERPFKKAPVKHGEMDVLMARLPKGPLLATEVATQKRKHKKKSTGKKPTKKKSSKKASTGKGKKKKAGRPKGKKGKGKKKA